MREILGGALSSGLIGRTSPTIADESDQKPIIDSICALLYARNDSNKTSTLWLDADFAWHFLNGLAWKPAANRESISTVVMELNGNTSTLSKATDYGRKHLYLLWLLRGLESYDDKSDQMIVSLESELIQAICQMLEGHCPSIKTLYYGHLFNEADSRLYNHVRKDSLLEEAAEGFFSVNRRRRLFEDAALYASNDMNNLRQLFRLKQADDTVEMITDRDLWTRTASQTRNHQEDYQKVNEFRIELRDMSRSVSPTKSAATKIVDIDLTS